MVAKLGFPPPDSALAAVEPIVQEPGALLWLLGLGAVVGVASWVAMVAKPQGEK